MADLRVLEYPRHVHGQPWQTVYRIVRDEAECAVALAEGWTLTCEADPPPVLVPAAPIGPEPVWPVAEPLVVPDVPWPEPVVEPTAVAPKRGRGRPAKAKA